MSKLPHQVILAQRRIKSHPCFGIVNRVVKLVKGTMGRPSFVRAKYRSREIASLTDTVIYIAEFRMLVYSRAGSHPWHLPAVTKELAALGNRLKYRQISMLRQLNFIQLKEDYRENIAEARPKKNHQTDSSTDPQTDPSAQGWHARLSIRWL